MAPRQATSSRNQETDHSGEGYTDLRPENSSDPHFRREGQSGIPQTIIDKSIRAYAKSRTLYCDTREVVLKVNLPIPGPTDPSYKFELREYIIRADNSNFVPLDRGLLWYPNKFRNTLTKRFPKAKNLYVHFVILEEWRRRGLSRVDQDRVMKNVESVLNMIYPAHNPCRFGFKLEGDERLWHNILHYWMKDGNYPKDRIFRRLKLWGLHEDSFNRRYDGGGLEAV